MPLWVLGLSASQRDVLGIYISVAIITVNAVQFSDRKKHHGKSEGDGERAGGIALWSSNQVVMRADVGTQSS